MQTFLAYPDYHQSMNCLDKSRLGNQVWREGLTLIRGGWPNHPASKMWRGHQYHLGLYLLAGIEVLRDRGKYYSQVCEKIYAEMARFTDTGAPPWLGDNTFHASHRSNLLRKDPVWYGQFGWSESPDLPYYWPVQGDKNMKTNMKTKCLRCKKNVDVSKGHISYPGGLLHWGCYIDKETKTRPFKDYDTDK